MNQAFEEPADRRRRRTRAAILDAAAELFTENGFRRTGVEQLAETADVALSSIYANFPGGKADVYAVLACRSADEHVDAMRAALADVAPDEFTAAVFDEYRRYHREHPLAFRLLGLVDIEPSDTDLYGPARRRITDRLTGLVDEVVATSGVESGTVRREVVLMWATVNGLLGLRSQGFVDEAEYTRLLDDLRPGTAS
ncbi:MAG: TetR/AcrR family transcriptional regulator [Gordonia sp. (in: high G+C Gram-positive bacteria)]|uniref:TetR/AcrR family transcriptional regulator n=1 Tax=Gordonia sp. (in: high G+C Gram-positive bacteria) TaxID=84139 RepID=UPI0039E61136